MGWEKRGNHSYLYLSVRENGRVVKKYLGTGPEAEMAAELIQATREKRAINRTRLNDAKAKLKAIDQWEQLSPAPPHAIEATANPPAEPSNQSSVSTPPEVLDRARELVKSCRSGDKNAERELRDLIEKYPAVMRRCGDLASIARSKWLTLAVGDDSVNRAAAIKKIEELRSQFPKSQNPCSELLVERIVISWLKIAFAENRMADFAPDDKAAFEFLARLQQRAEQQHLRAIQMWEYTERQCAEKSGKSESMAN